MLYTPPKIALGIFVSRIVDSRDGGLVCLSSFCVWYEIWVDAAL